MLRRETELWSPRPFKNFRRFLHRRANSPYTCQMGHPHRRRFCTRPQLRRRCIPIVRCQLPREPWREWSECLGHRHRSASASSRWHPALVPTF